MKNKKRILLSPLDWGLGHATRCIPIAKAIENAGHKIIFATNGRSLDLLIKEFPKHEFIKIPGYNIQYPKNGNMSTSMFWQIPKIIKAIKKEHKQLQSIISDFDIQGVISDNRYGMYSKDIPSVLITHQLNIQVPFFQNLLNKITLNQISKFDACWVPDTIDHLLTGALTKGVNLPITTHFIGPLSRFQLMQKTQDLNILAIVSGPEPQRTIFQKKLEVELKDKNAVMILGKPEENTSKQIGDFKILSHLNTKDLNQLIINSDIIISRSGYSTIMDLAALGKKAVFIPTPGQTEQLYLADHFYKKNIAFAMHQNELNIELALSESKKFLGFNQSQNNVNFSELIKIFEE